MTPINNFQMLTVCYLGGKDEMEEEITTDESFDSFIAEIKFEIPSNIDLDAEAFLEVQLENL